MSAPRGLDGNADVKQMGFADGVAVLDKNTGKAAVPAAAAAPVKAMNDNVDDGRTIKLVSKDKKEFVVPLRCALISTLIKTSMEEDKNSTEIPIPSVSGDILTEVVKYMNEHKGVEPPIVEKPLRSKVMKDVCPHKWDADFIDSIGEQRQKLYDTILAANYLDIKSLLHLGCAKVASLIKGQPLEKVKEILEPGKAAGAASATATAVPAAKK